MKQQPKKAAFTDALVDFGYVSTEIFRPSRGRPVGITRNGLQNLIDRGDFPKPVRLGSGTKPHIYWRLSDLQRWIESRVTTSEAGAS